MPVDVEQMARTCVANNIGLGYAYRNDIFVARSTDITARCDGEPLRGGATLFARGTFSTPSGAAFSNTVLFGANRRSDTLGTLHVGQIAIATALALLEAHGYPQSRLLPAIVAGYEVGGRLDLAYGERVALAGFRSTPLFGAIAAAATAAVAMALGPDQAASALGFAACMAGGLLQPFEDGSDDPRLQPGVAARLGLLAAEMAHSGSRSARNAVEGRCGLIRAVARCDCDPAQLTASLGEEWLVLNTTFKRYPVCAFAQTPIAAALGVKERIGRRAVKSISIALSPREVAYPGLDNAGPYFSNTETNMSVLYCVAHTLVYGPPTTDADLTKFRDPALERLLECTRLVSDDDLQPLWTGIVIELENGEVVSGLQRPSSHALTAEGAVQEMVREVLRLEPDYEQRLKAVNTFMSSLPALSPGDVTRLFAVQ